MMDQCSRKSTRVFINTNTIDSTKKQTTAYSTNIAETSVTIQDVIVGKFNMIILYDTVFECILFFF